MKVTIDDEGALVLSELYNGIGLEADPGFMMAVAHRDCVFQVRVKDGPLAEWGPWLDWGQIVGLADDHNRWKSACDAILIRLAQKHIDPGVGPSKVAEVACQQISDLQKTIAELKDTLERAKNEIHLLEHLRDEDWGE